MNTDPSLNNYEVVYLSSNSKSAKLLINRGRELDTSDPTVERYRLFFLKLLVQFSFRNIIPDEYLIITASWGKH